ncbi:MAG: YHS domain-containing (seleno)protein [Planctomycetota bacterium]
MLKNTLLSTALVALAAAAATASGGLSAPAGPPASEGGASRAYLHSYNVPGHGVALEGYSPVSYFEGQAERGSALFAVEHDGLTYHLTDAAQARKFAGSPAKYLPAYGGWCAFGMAVKDKFPIDPTLFKIVDGRLLLFLRNAGVDARELWDNGEERQLLHDADAHWGKVQG